MKKSVIVTLILLLVYASGMAERKKVAVVLGGGGAKGVSHIGVLKVLEEAGIPIDYIVGTSMGAIVGGFYAMGYSAAEIDSMVREQDWPMLLSDKNKRHNLSFAEKENSERYLFSLPIGKNKRDKMTGGVIKGQNIQKLFSNLSIGYHDSLDFNRLSTPFACVALDLVSGRDHVFHSGNLPLAMRASMAIPAVFTPVRLDSMVLVDGGIINNYPANVARDMGADLIIGVDLGTSDLKLVDGINTPGDVVGQIIALYGYDKYSHNREITDLLLRPDMTPYNSASFTKAAIDTLINRGEQEARKRWDELITLKQKIYEGELSGKEKEKVAFSPVRPEHSFSIGKICFEGTDPRDEKWLLRLSRLKENQDISLPELEKAVSILMGTNSYSHVSYQLTGKEPYTLHLILQEKSNSSLNLGLRYDTEENISLLLNGTFDYRSKARSRFALTGRLGKSSYGRLDYALERSPLRNIHIAYMFRYQDIDIYRRGDKTYNSTYQHHLAEAAFSDMTWLNFKVTAGIRYEYFNYNSFLYKEDYHDFTVRPEGFISYFGSAHLETLDSRYFPNRGVSLEAHYSMYTDNFVGYNGKSPFSSVQLGFTSAIRLRSHLTLIPSLYGRVLIGGNLAYPYLNALGGEVPSRYLPQQVPFAGINHIEIVDNSVGVIRLQVRQRLWSRNYITLTGNYGIHHDDFFSILKGRHLWGASLGYAYNSLAGPLSTSLSISDWSKSVLFYLNLGYTF